MVAALDEVVSKGFLEEVAGQLRTCGRGGAACGKLEEQLQSRQKKEQVQRP